MQKDPVCGGSSEYNGKTYYFCSASCKQKFDRDPKPFAK
jgi:YHS domain-containing protein